MNVNKFLNKTIGHLPHIFPAKYRVLEVKMENGDQTFYPQERGRLFIYRTMTRKNGTVLICDNMQHAQHVILGRVQDERMARQSRTVAEKNIYQFNEVFEKLKQE